MQTFQTAVGAAKPLVVQATPIDAASFPAAEQGNSATTGSDDTIAKVIDHSGDGNTISIAGFKPGTAVFSQSGHDVNGAAFSAQFAVNVEPGPAVSFLFAQVTS